MQQAKLPDEAGFDYSSDVEEIKRDQRTKSDKLAQLSALALQQEELQAAYEEAEKQLKEAAQRLAQVAEQEIPALMLDVGMENFTTADGLTVEVKETLRCSLSEANKAEGIAWLEAHDLGDVVKNAIVARFDRDEEKFFRKFVSDLRRRKRPINFERTAKVEGATLRKTLQEAIESGLTPPEKTFAIHWQKRSKIKRKKSK